MTNHVLMELASWTLVGLALGLVYLRLLGRSVSAITEAGSWVSASAWMVLRGSLAVSALWLAAQQGTLPLLSVLAGFLVSRSVAIHRVRRADHGR